MAKFDWQTDDEYDWDKPEPVPESPKRSWRIVIPIVLVVMLGVAGYLIYDRINDVVDEVSAERESELVATVGLLYERAAANDADIFQSMISGRDRSWSAAQLTSVAAGQWGDLSAFGLTQSGDDVVIGEIWISPDLDSAEVTTTVSYLTAQNETVTLNMPLVFRQGSPLWIYAPPLEPYWGDTLTETFGQLEVTFPARDAELARQLATDLANGLTALCVQNAGLCPDFAFRTIKIDFSIDPTVLLELGSVAAAQPTAFNGSLPAPSLIGLPTDDAGYQSLLYGFARQVFTNEILSGSGYVCCNHTLYADAMIERMLINAGMAYEVISAEQLAKLYLQLPISLAEPAHWQTRIVSSQAYTVTAAEQIEIAAVVRFAREHLQLNLVQGLPSLASGQEFSDWALELLNDEMRAKLRLNVDFERESRQPIRELALAFAQFLPKAGGLISALPSGQAPISYPEAPIGLTCENASNSAFVLWSLLEGSFESVYEPEGMFINRVELHRRSSGFVIEQQPESRQQVSSNSEVVLLDESGVRPLVPGTNLKLYDVLSDSAERVAISRLDNGSGGLGSTRAVDVMACDGDNCPALEFANTPTVSPDGTRSFGMRYFTFSGQMLDIYDELGEVTHRITLDNAFGPWPFWIDENTIAFGAEGSSLKVYDLTTESFETIFDPTNFSEAIDYREETEPWLWYTVNEADRNELFVAIGYFSNGDSQQRSYIFNLATREISQAFDDVQLISSGPNNRFLYAIKFTNGIAWESVLDRERDNLRLPLSQYEAPRIWLDDGNWLLRSAENHLQLIAPAHGYVEYLAPPEGMTCYGATPFPEQP